MSRNRGTYNYSANLEVKKRTPLDAKQLVETKQDLTGTTTWTNDGNEYTYVGMIVSVSEDTTPSNNGIYRLTADDYTNIVNWEYIGATGAQGTIGAQGVQGLTGAQGVQGLEGIQGVSGLTGVQGTLGAQGVQGLEGIQGVSGLTGAQGTLGAQGISGLTGSQGVQGLEGIQGVQGLLGAQGTIGIQGNEGIPGLPGVQGVSGLTGSQGIQGLEGIQGVSGATGTQGIQGTDGVQGVSGLTGAQGVQGAIDPTLSTSLSTEISTRTSADLSLSSAISTVSGSTTDITSNLSQGQLIYYTGTTLSGTTNLFPSLSTAISEEVSSRISDDLSLSSAIIANAGGTGVTSLSSALSSEISVRTSADLSLSSAISVAITGSTSLSSVLSSEISSRSSMDTALSTAFSNALSTEISIRSSVDTSLSTAVVSVSSALSSEISVRASADLSLSSALSSEISVRTSSVTSLSTILSSEISVRASGDLSLSTAVVSVSSALSSEISVRTSSVTSLSTVLSSEISVRTSQVLSLSTAVAAGGGSGSTTLSGLTDVSLSGLSYNDMLYYSGTTWKNTPNLWTQSNSAVTLFNDNFDLSLSNIEMTEDGGSLIAIDMSVTTGVTVGAEESYSFNIDGNSVVRIYGQASGTTGVTNTGLVLDGSYYYLGEPTSNGSWRWFINTTGEIEFQKLTGGTWTYNSKFTFNTTSSTSTGFATNSFQISGASYSSIVITGITSGTTTLGANNQNFVTEQAIKNYADSVGGGTGATSLSTALSSEISVRTSGDLSLSTAISAIVNATGTTTSVSTALSSEISVRTSADLSLSTVLSSEISVRSSVDLSLSSAIAAGGVTGVTSLSSALSSEISVRTSVDASLSTAIANSDDWATHLNTNNFLYYDGTTISGTTNFTYSGSSLWMIGNLYVSSAVTAQDLVQTSDERLKTNIQSISTNPTNINFKQFEFKDNLGQIRYGVIAQSLLEEHSELIRFDENGIMGISYIDLLIFEINNLKKRIEELENKIK